eukprot:1179362-Prorocentrum_minimum.AAC.3
MNVKPHALRCVQRGRKKGARKPYEGPTPHSAHRVKLRLYNLRLRSPSRRQASGAGQRVNSMLTGPLYVCLAENERVDRAAKLRDCQPDSERSQPVQRKRGSSVPFNQ